MDSYDGSDSAKHLSIVFHCNFNGTCFDFSKIEALLQWQDKWLYDLAGVCVVCLKIKGKASSHSKEW